MISFIHKFCFVGGFALAGIDLVAETTPASSEAKTPAPRLLSPELKAELGKDLPIYEPVKPSPLKNAKQAVPAKADDDDDKESVLVLPSVVVRGQRPAKLTDILSDEGKLEHYLGPKKGFDRGLLNRVVLRWGNGLIQVSLFNAVKNETRAKTLYWDDQRLRNRTALLDFASVLKETGDTELSDRLKRESDDLFFRKPTLSRK